MQVPTQEPLHEPAHEILQIPLQRLAQIPRHVGSQEPSHVPRHTPLHVPRHLPSHVSPHIPLHVSEQNPRQLYEHSFLQEVGGADGFSCAGRVCDATLKNGTASVARVSVRKNARRDSSLFVDIKYLRRRLLRR